MSGLLRAATSPLRRGARTTRLAAGAGALGLVLSAGLVPLPCPLLFLTGFDCPFCGGSRMLGALLHGDLARAVDLNAFALVLVLPVAVLFLIASARQEVRGIPSPWLVGRPGRWAANAVLAAAVVWGVVRNLPGFEALRA
ncbi:DUF2752 domain-containing protein [Saccharopolyspora sp. 7B]|uniref:DUF2752 domain-containing protein n=1 Tax=Saccharopolyspora sp. 7B TaxID=2877240 RepID=UPI001CD7D12D|nr:DUF2752 domain-containing protein [Saccharopolyspora sp. 7B]MCA1279199.1 DUF2752 domain-containing protein [Saccharopolyspora sp. 7B]